MATARLNRFLLPGEANLLLLAALFSLWAHGVFLTLFLLHPSWFHVTKHATAAELKLAQQLRQQAQHREEPPMLFVQVDPAQAVTEAPKNAKYYSTQNTKAANVDAKVQTDVPKIDGTQTHVPKTEDTPRPKSIPPQPAAPKTPTPEPAQAPAEEKKPPGDLAMAKPPEPKPEPLAPHRRPQRLVDVEPNKLAGERMKQDGGVERRRVNLTLDAVGSKFGEYDERIIQAIQMHWYDLIDNAGVSLEKTGRVALRFHLNYDGSISEMTVVYSDVNELQTLLCKKAIMDAAPYERWPDEMRRQAAADFRDVTFTFYYE